MRDDKMTLARSLREAMAAKWTDLPTEKAFPRLSFVAMVAEDYLHRLAGEGAWPDCGLPAGLQADLEKALGRKLPWGEEAAKPAVSEKLCPACDKNFTPANNRQEHCPECRKNNDREKDRALKHRKRQEAG